MRTILLSAVLATATLGAAAAQTVDVPPAMPGTLVALRLPPMPLITLAGVSAHDIVGASVRNERNEHVGRVRDFTMGSQTVDRIVVSSGGVLGIGARRSELSRDKVTFARDGREFVVVIAPAGSWVAQLLPTPPLPAAAAPQPEDRTTLVPAGGPRRALTP
jgi:hypothetical protein